MNELIILVLCHLVGDYVLQSDYIARTKGENWYHLFVHAVLYSVPFIAVYGTSKAAYYLALDHAVIDALKARYKIIGYAADQAAHYLSILLFVAHGGIGL